MTTKELIRALQAIKEPDGEVHIAVHTYSQGFKGMVTMGKSTFEERGYESCIFQYSGIGGIRIDLHLSKGYRISKHVE